MKRLLFGYVIIFFVVALIGLGGAYFQRYLEQTANELTLELTKVKKIVKQEDWEGSIEEFNTFNEKWNKVRNNWAMFTDHFEIDNIDMKLVRSQEFIKAKDAVNAVVELSEAIMLLEHIPERERLTLQNIF